MRRAMMCIVSGLLIAGLAGVVRAGDEGDAVPVTSLHKVVQQITEQAEQSWQQNAAWPQTPEPLDNVKLAERDVVRALTTPQHKHPAVDAYIKGQLLGMVPDLSETDAPTIRRILGAQPRLGNLAQTPEQRPKAAGTGRAYIHVGNQLAYVSDLTPVGSGNNIAYDPEISVINTGGLLDVEGYVVVRRTILKQVPLLNARLIRQLKIVGEANRPNLAYREALIAQLDDHRELQLAARLQDAADRIRAGEPSAAQAIETFVAQTGELAQDRSVSPAARQALIGQLEKLRNVQTKVITSIETDGDRRIKANRDIIEFPEIELDKAIAHLRGA